MSTIQNNFLQLLTKISDKLSADEVKSFSFMLRNEGIPIQKLDDAKTGENIFDLMMKHGLLSLRNTEKLKEILRTKQLEPCVKIIERFVDENEEEITKAVTGPCNIVEEMVVEHFKETHKLDELRNKIETGGFATLSGLLGCGKSQLALWYALMFRKHNSGICWKINCQNDMNLLNSLKKFVDKFDLDKNCTKQGENQESNQSLDSLRSFILTEIKKFAKGESLVILDDVMDETQVFCKQLKDSLLKLGVKVIVTTWNHTFCDEKDLIVVTGFTKQEAIDFLKRDKETRPNDDKSYSDLVEELDSHPLLLYGARTCMAASHQTPKKFLKYLKSNKSLSEMDRMVSRSISEPSDNRELFRILSKYLDILKNDEGNDVFDMFLVLQFLALDDIPVLIFDFLPSSSGTLCRDVHTTNFLQAIQRFAFGMLRGEDDGRFITTHLAVVKTINKHTDVDEKVRIMKKLLSALMWLMDKDNYHSNDYDRNQILLPNAIATLKHVESLVQQKPELKEDFEFLVLLAYVNDIVGYTYNFFGILKNAGEHSTAAKEACFRLIGLTEPDIEKHVSQTCVRNAQYKTWEKFAEFEGNLIFEKIKDQLKDPVKTNILNLLAKSFVLNKYRGQGQIEMLESFLGDSLEEDYILTEIEYETLCEKHLAIPEQQLGHLFLFELILQVFYTFGRRIFYLGDAYSKDIARTFAHSLFLAHAIGKRISLEFPEWNLLYVMSSELSGTLELCFDDKPDLDLKTLENLENAAEKFKKFLETKTSMFIFGVVKLDTKNSQHEHICCKRLVKCYSSMTKLATTDEKRKEIFEKGQLYANQLEKTKQSSLRNLMSANLRNAEFSLLQKDYLQAEKQFKVVAPEDVIEFDQEMKKSVLTHNELQALKGLTKCYALSGQTELAKSLSQRIKCRLGITHEVAELDHFNNLLSELSLQ